MKILTVENKTYTLEKIPEYVDDSLRFAVLDNSNPSDPDYFYIPLIMLQQRAHVGRARDAQRLLARDERERAGEVLHHELRRLAHPLLIGLHREVLELGLRLGLGLGVRVRGWG